MFCDDADCFARATHKNTPKESSTIEAIKQTHQNFRQMGNRPVHIPVLQITS